MNLLIMTDTHLSASIPAGRKGDYILHVDKKLQEIADIAREYDVAAILCAGDVFHRPAPSISAIGRFLTFLELANTRFITIAGSHDLFGENFDSLYRTAIGMLDRLGRIELLCPETKNVTRVGDIAIGTSLSRVKDIELAHGSILPEPELVGNYTLIKDYSSRAKLVVVGHYHTGYKEVVHDETTFLCPGSVVRTQAQKSEIVRRPKVAIVSDNFEIEWIELESALPGEEVLVPPVVTQKLDFTETIREWSSIKIEEAEVTTLVKEVAKKEKTHDDVVEYALGLLEE